MNEVHPELRRELRSSLGLSEPEFTSVHWSLGTWRLSVGRQAVTEPEVTRIYDRSSAYWSQLIGLLGYQRAYRKLLAQLRDQGILDARSTGAVLDCGAGTGALGSAFVDVFGRGADVYAADLSSRMLLHARRRMEGQDHRLYAVAADALQLPFASQRFDLVMAGHMLEHTSKPRTTIEELSRMLKPGGKLLLVITRAGVVDSLLRMFWRYRLLHPNTVRRWLWDADLRLELMVPLTGGRFQVSRQLSLAVVATKV